MAGDDTIEQRAFGRRARFHFGEDKVEFRYADSSGEVSASAFYEAIDLDNPTRVRVNLSRQYLWIVLALAVATGFGLGSLGARALANIPLLLYVAFLLAVRFGGLFSVRIIVLSVTIGNAVTRLRVIEDAKRDKVLEGLRAGWTARMRKLHATVRNGADPAVESQRFRWLLDRKVINYAEYQNALALIQLASAPLSQESRTLN